jgi:hypothetical protein
LNPVPRFSTLLALGLVTAVALAEQVMITRLFSAVMAYHFSFLAISIAMLGTGSAAMLVYLRSASFQSGTPESVLSRWTTLFVLSLLIAPLGLVRLDFTGAEALSAGFGLNLAVACVLAALPAFTSGVVVAVAIQRFQDAIGKVYAFDLVGAGLGALVVVPVLALGPAPNLIVALGVVAAVAAVLFAGSAKVERRRALGVGVGAAVLLVLGGITSILYLDPQYGLKGATIVKVAERWTPLARVFGFRIVHPQSPAALLFYDRVYAPVVIVSPGEIPDWRKLRTGPASIGFTVAGPGRTLIIGGGGGRDIYNALSNAQRPVDVIELIDGNRRVVDEDLGSVSGSPYSRPGVNTVIGDGRSTLAARDTLYDQIHIGFTDTLTANAAQGFALTENNLYTVEAFNEYFDHLKPKGILNVSRLLKLVGDEALRATVLMLEALRQRGIEDPFKHVIVILGTDFLGPPTGTILARLTPFTSEEVEQIRALAKERANGLLMAPYGPNQLAWEALAKAPSVQAFCQGYHLDVCPPTDDRPFFFHMARIERLGEWGSDGYAYTSSPAAVLLLTLIVLSVLCVLGFVLPLRFGPKTAGRVRVSSLTYFGAIGLGFLLFEIALIQRLVLLLGFPTYALSVVLFALLVSSGIGSFISSRWQNQKQPLIAILAATFALLVVGAFGIPPLLGPVLDASLAVRVIAAVLVIAPFGLVLGMAMPLGLARLGKLEPLAVPYAWGVNGIASVLASVLGVFLATELGFTAVFLSAAACYAFALAHAALGKWPMSTPA